MIRVQTDPASLSATEVRHLAIQAARGKRASRDVARFLLDLDAESRALAAALAAATYVPGTGRSFWIRDPKPRRIYALPFRDRVVQHALVGATLDAIDRRLVSQTYACRTGKGTHLCLERAAEWFRRRAYVLRVDIRRFFPSIDHAILRRLLDRMTPIEWRWLRDRFLDMPAPVERVAFHFPGDDLFTPIERPHGLPIGSLTSQIWANVYLSPMDEVLSSHLGIGSFVRYCDDILIFDDDPRRLHDALAQLEARATALRLRLHPGKTRLHRTTDPVPFLGFVLRRAGSGTSIRLRHENVLRMRERMAHTRVLFEIGAIEPGEITSRLRAWLAHAKHGHTRSLVRAELARLVWIGKGTVDAAREDEQ